MTTNPLILAGLVAIAGTACDKSPSKLDELVEASTNLPSPRASGAPTTSATPAPPSAPSIAVDDGACSINGEEVLFAGPDPKGRIASILATNPLIVGQLVTFDAARETKTPKVGIVVLALKQSKAKGALVHTPMRDKNIGELPLLLQHGPIGDCSAVGMVNKDGSIAVWPAGGGVAQKFVRGFAGPDLTLGPEALHKVANACDSATWLVAADDNVPWGLTFDLALATRGSPEAGVLLRASQTLLVAEAPVPGRKVVAP